VVLISMNAWLWILLGLVLGFISSMSAYSWVDRGSSWTRRIRFRRSRRPGDAMHSRASASDAPSANDLLGFRRLADPLAGRIAEVPISDTPWTIGLFGEWGAGKTSFMLMVDDSLRRRSIESVWFNAWKYSHEETLWTALLQTVLDRTRISGPAWRRPIVAFRLWLLTLDVRAGTWEVVRKVGSLVLRLSLFILAVIFAASALSGGSGAASSAAHSLLASQSWSKGILDQNWVRGILAFLAFLLAGPSILWKAFDPHLRIDYTKFARTKSYAERIAFIDEFSAHLQRIVRISGHGKPLVVMIDDLDRCLPEQVLQIIDAVKMFLDVPGCVFLLAVDRDIIEDAVELKYAEGTSGPRLRKLRETYAERIIQMPLSLPPALPGIARNFVRNLAGEDADVMECAPILIGAPPYNPRRIKRSIQTFALYRDFAPSGDNDPRLLPSLLAKLTVIQYHYRELYRAVTDDENLLPFLERAYRDSLKPEEVDENYSELADKYSTLYPDLPGLLRLQIAKNDAFFGVLLEPYLSYFRSVSLTPETDASAEPQAPVTAPATPGGTQLSPIPAVRTVDRRELREKIEESLQATPQVGSLSVTALVGGGGCGKTSLAKIISSEKRMTSYFKGGIFFVQLGPDIHRVDLAAKINDLTSLISGSWMTLTDAELAGQALGHTLDVRPSISFGRRPSRTLLIIDDVWTADQLAPFLIGGQRCVRLITTRNPGVVPAAAHSVLVDVMPSEQVAEIISSGLPEFSRDLLRSLTSASGGWPLLASLINRTIADRVRIGQDPSSAAAEVLSRLHEDGPTALDVANTFDRGRAIAATLDASLNTLSNEDIQRFYELGAFAEDLAIPLKGIEALWRVTANLGPDQARVLIERLAMLSLIARSPGGFVIIHDVIRSYIRAMIDSGKLADLEHLISDHRLLED
jgi:hypothetical protein